MRKILCLIALSVVNFGFAQTLMNFNGYQYVEIDGTWKFKDPTSGHYYDVSDEHISLKYNTSDLPTLTAFEALNDLAVVYRSQSGWNTYRITEAPASIFTYAGDLLADEIVTQIEIGTFGEYLSSPPPVNPPNDAGYAQQWYFIDNPSDIDIDMLDAWSISTGSNQVKVGVIDGGFHWDMNDLGKGPDAYENVGKNWFEPWLNELDPTTGDNAAGNDPNPHVDDFKGWHFENSFFWPQSNDTRTGVSHGTGVSSIIAAKTNNSIGLAGVAGGWGDEGVQIFAGVINNENPMSQNYNIPVGLYIGPAIDYLVGLGVKVININVGAGWNLVAADAIEMAHSAGVTIVCASGNSPVFLGVDFPANDPKTIAVGASSPTDNRWQVINGNESNYGPELDVVAPGQDIVAANSAGTLSLQSGTSWAAPIVTGIVALMLSENPCLSPEQVRQILRSTSEKVNPNTYNYNFDYMTPGRSEKMGYGRVNAYQALLAAQNMNNLGFDLYARDHYLDYGADASYPFTWDYDESPDIWVRNQDDGEAIQEHEDYLNYWNGGGNAATKFVYVRVSNAGCSPSWGTEVLKLNTTAAMTSGIWPAGWDNFSSGGQYIGSAPIPVIQPGESEIVKVPWTLMYNINSCILARITNENGDPIGTLPPDISMEVYNQNNLALRNVFIYDMGPLTPFPIFDNVTMTHGSPVTFVNPGTANTTFDFSFISETNAIGHYLTDDAEVTMTFNDDSWDLFSDVLTGRSDIRIIGTRTIEFLQSTVSFDDIVLPAGVQYEVFIGYSFLTEQINEEDKYEINFVQKYDTPDPIVGDHWTGGVHLKVKRNDRMIFLANAGSDQTITSGETATLEAEDINEPATYNWSELEGERFASEMTTEVSPTTTTTYQLEVIATADGFKDYDEVTVNVYKYVIQSLSPNPASANITVQYLAEAAATAQLDIVGISTNDFMSISLDTMLTSSTFDISQLASGVYSVVLVCDGVMVDVVQLSVL